MNTKQDIVNTIDFFENTWCDFYKERIDHVLNAQKQSNILEAIYLEKSRIVESSKECFPKAVIKGRADKTLLIKLKNIDFRIGKCHEEDTLFIDRYYSIKYYKPCLYPLEKLLPNLYKPPNFFCVNTSLKKILN